MRIVNYSNIYGFKSIKSEKDVNILSLVLIKNAEGFSPIPYLDRLGNRTIGYGFNMSLPQFSNYKAMTEMDASDLLFAFIEKLYPVVLSKICFGKEYSENIMSVLMDMSYNLGIEGLSNFDSFLSLLRLGKIDNAVSDLTNTLWYSQVGQRAIRNCFNLLTTKNYLYLI